MPRIGRGGRKVIIAPDGGAAWALAKPQHDETLIRALARAHRWKRMLDAFPGSEPSRGTARKHSSTIRSTAPHPNQVIPEGAHGSVSEIAEAEKIDRSYVNRLLRLTLLAPDIHEAILDGRQPKGMQLEELVRTMPSGWERQRELIMLP